jgi:hypothetical protein
MRRTLFALSAAALLTFGAGQGRADSLALDLSTPPNGFAGTFPSPFTSGWVFTTSQAFTATALGYWDEADHVLNANHDVGLWDDMGNLLAQTTITNASTPVASADSQGQWLFNPISPLLLPAGTYHIGGTTNNQDIVCSGTGVTTIPGVTFDGGAETPGAGLTFPPGPPGKGAPRYFGPDVELTSAIPEPSTLALLGVGAAGLFGDGWRRRQRRA